MTANLHFEDIFTSIFETVVNSISSMKKEVLNTLLMNLIFSMNTKNKELRQLFSEIEEEPERILNMNLDDFFDAMLQLEDNFSSLLKLANIHKDKSDIFMQFYKSIDELYATTVYVNLEVGFIESELNHSLEMKNAS